MEYDILLINIYRDSNGYSQGFRDSIGQYILAAYIRQHGFVGKVYSGTVQQCHEVIEQELSGGHVGVIGFYAAADNIRVVSHAIKWIKSNYSATTIVGGPQAIALDGAFFKNTGNDFAITGEGEIPLHMLLSYLIDGDGEINSIPSIVYFDGVSQDTIWNYCEDAVISDLDSLPFPRMEDSLDGKLRQSSMVGLITGRGCPNHCTFCYEGANAKNVRFRSIDNVMEEIDYIISNNPRVDFINIYDDTFTLQPARIQRFCEEIKKRGIRWFCEGHVSFVVQHPELFRTMVESGLTCIQFGIESANQAVLDAYNKKTSAEMILECIEICKRSGVVGVTGNFIIGGAHETRDTLRESRELAARMIDLGKGMVELFSVYFAPYPNTQMAEHPERFGIARHPELESWNLNTMRSPVVSTAGLSVSDIHKEKQLFDSFLNTCYLEAALRITKAELINSLYIDGKRIHINAKWEEAFTKLDYLISFANHISDDEQRFDPNGYPIRTFEDYLTYGEILQTEAGSFSGLEKILLLNSTGILTCTELAEKLRVSLDQIRDCFNSLNDRCLIYMSSW